MKLPFCSWIVALLSAAVSFITSMVAAKSFKYKHICLHGPSIFVTVNSLHAFYMSETF